MVNLIDGLEYMALAQKTSPAELASKSIHIEKPYLVFLGDVTDPLEAKTAFGLRDWIPEDLVGQWRLHPGAVDLGLPDLDPSDAVKKGARSLVIGIAPAGGKLPPHWQAALKTALAAGLNVVSGLHTKLEQDGGLVRAAKVARAPDGLPPKILDIRVPPSGLEIGCGFKRTGKRILTVAGDCAIGKKYAALALARDMQRAGFDATFRASGQTGIMIAGGGLPIDSVVSDFLAGAAEALSPAAAPTHWDVVEGQGSLFHPSYAAVSLGLLHGTQPDILVYCHHPDRSEIDGCPEFSIPSIEVGIARNLEAARLTNPGARWGGISVDTSKMSKGSARRLLDELQDTYNVPAMDPLRFGAGTIVDNLRQGAS
ncbi:MAG: DUF1611 domain-containing protein [Pseudomonadota bacterium]